MGGISDRMQEIRRRRNRRRKYKKLAAKLQKATSAERAVIAAKIRNMTPGCNVILERWGLVDE